MKLELKHLSPYLPYGLEGKESPEHPLYKLKSLSEDKFLWAPVYEEGNIEGRLPQRVDCKPILRPLSDLTFQELRKWGFVRMPNEFEDFENYSFGFAQYCFRHHMDIFGLIPQGLAIDTNTLKETV